MIQIDMQMPKNCLDCPACNEYLLCAIPVNGRTWGENDVREFGQGRPEWCPMEENEAKPPAIMQDVEGIWSICSMCGHKLRPILAMKMDTYFPKFCSECGQAVKWE